MTLTNPTLATIREQLTLRRDTLRRRFRVARLAVFGSHARGTARKRSDVDILVWNSSSTCSASYGDEWIW